MKTKYYSLIGLSMFLTLQSVSAMTIMGPDRYSFKMTADHPDMDCETVMKHVTAYKANGCLEAKDSSDCDMDGSVLINLAGLKTYQGRGDMTFRPIQYSIQMLSTVKNAPAVPVPDFDKSYVLNAKLNGDLSGITFLSSDESQVLAISTKLNIPTGVEYGDGGGQKTATIKNRLIACAFESHQLKLVGGANLLVSPYHPENGSRVNLLASLIRKASQLSVSENTVSQKQFLLGTAAGDILRQSGTVYPLDTLDRVLLSMQSVVLKNQEGTFEVISTDSSAENIASTLMNGAKSVSANVELVF